MNAISGKQEDAVTLPETVTDSSKTITEKGEPFWFDVSGWGSAERLTDSGSGVKVKRLLERRVFPPRRGLAWRRKKPLGVTLYHKLRSWFGITLQFALHLCDHIYLGVVFP